MVESLISYPSLGELKKDLREATQMVIDIIILIADTPQKNNEIYMKYKSHFVEFLQKSFRWNFFEDG